MGNEQSVGTIMIPLYHAFLEAKSQLKKKKRQQLGSVGECLTRVRERDYTIDWMDGTHLKSQKGHSRNLEDS